MVTEGRGNADRERDDYDDYYEGIRSMFDDPRYAEPTPEEERTSEEGKRELQKITIRRHGPASLPAGISLKSSVEEIWRTVSQASQRVGHSEEDRARWLVGFAVADLSRLSRGQRLDLESEILAFITPPRSTVLHLEIDTDSEIRMPVDELHTWIRAGIESLHGDLPDLPPGVEVDEEAEAGYLDFSDDADRVYQILAVRAERRRPGYRPEWVLEASRTCCLFRVGERVFADTEGSGSTRERFEAEALRVLSSEVERFRFCRNCRKPFIARKRQAYCSSTCSQTFRTRTYRAKDPERARGRRRADYERAQKKIHGPHVRVGHRKPKNPGRSEDLG